MDIDSEDQIVKFWIKQHLRARFGSIINEAVPDALLCLLHGSNACTDFEITDDRPDPDGPTSTAQEG
ncbi:hypothetical protein GCM10022398_22210 [Acetobacter lovaniensis]|jgi:hypothetical protein|uniref:Uncharacterized protein n=2 Tax=Acetobacteraceae TaxID=433 RepID=A0A318Q4A9_9PROT|nr:hypothetical protein [Gluconobacter sp. R75690]MBF0875580.1 hypothetical protein [Gluconobacter cerevisiae]MBF0880321.1 hypothetical protein [Gluconobacter sp. R75828]NHN82126.1 hypothetical protein [Acetobacter lovaniensis]NHN92519.1 hypothetical protein [Acetobacter sicerae]NHO19185.1 hypothetical protein [Acetobacter oeni]PYD63803.1 hypothetical protein CFR72_04810 [Gluconacetobacter entanii]